MENPATAGFWLSAQQKHVWTLQQAGQAYRSVCLVENGSSQTAETILATLGEVVSRHEILRTIYVRQPGMSFPFQVVLDRATPSLETVNLVGLSAAEQASRIDELFGKEQVQSTGPEQAPILTAKLVSLGSSLFATSSLPSGRTTSSKATTRTPSGAASSGNNTRSLLRRWRYRTSVSRQEVFRLKSGLATWTV